MVRLSLVKENVNHIQDETKNLSSLGTEYVILSIKVPKDFTRKRDIFVITILFLNNPDYTCFDWFRIIYIGY